MFEFHGWISVDLADDTAGKKSSVNDIDSIKSLIEKHKNLQSKVDIFYQQGKPFIRFDGRLAHYQGWVLQLFFAINDKTNKSEGVLFIKDEENPCLDRQFRVWQMMDGEVLSGDMTFFPDKYNDLSHLQSL